MDEIIGMISIYESDYSDKMVADRIKLSPKGRNTLEGTGKEILW
jgi:hypothetical protein